jgi:hypothetical protein
VDLAYQTYRACWVAAVLGVVGTVIGMLAFSHVHAAGLREVQVLDLAVCFGLMLGMAIHRRPPRVAVGNLLFLLCLVPTVAMVWLIDEGRASEGLRWVPYEPTKLSAVSLALMAPPTLWVGAAAILMFIGSGLLHHLVLSETIRSRMASVEPWGLVAYGAFSLVLLFFQHRRHLLALELERERAERLALEKVADVALALRDLANTPTQTIELIRHELTHHDARTAVLAGHMRRALDQLMRLSDLLSRYAQAVTWNKRPPSFDAGTEAASLLNRRPEHRAPH